MLDNLKTIQIRFSLGEIQSDQLPNLALNLMSDGHESPSLIELAGQPPDSQDNARVFENALQEIGAEPVAIEEALRIRSLELADAIVLGTVEPAEGANTIRNIVQFAGVPDFREMDAIIYAASELEVRPKDLSLFSAMIVAEAKKVFEAREAMAGMR
jgi:hypothetical protein